MPRRVALYNGSNDALEEELVAARRRARAVGAPVGRLISSMTTSDTAENKLAMAVELDHMYIGCSDSKASIEKDIEVQHLKSLLLLHLDLIQQQAEQILAKEKQIKTLREENESLRTRLERLDRRVSLSLQKKPSEASTNTESETETTLGAVSPNRDEADRPPEESECSAMPGSPLGKIPLTSIGNKAGSPINAALPPVSTPTSPSSTTLPSLKVNSPCSSKSASPVSKSLSPGSKALSPSNKTSSSVSKPDSPTSQNESPNATVEPINKVQSPHSPLGPLDIKTDDSSTRASSPSKPGSPSSKTVSSKPLSPSNKAVSPSSKGSIPPNRVSSPPSKPGSPANKAASPPGEPASPPHKVVSPVSKHSSSPNKMGNTCMTGRTESLRKSSPKITSPKTSPKEKHQRENESNSTDTENYTESALLDLSRKEFTRGSERRERQTLKRKLEGESENEVVLKKTRAEESSDSSGATDHNLRSRDKPKEKVKEPTQSSPVPLIERPCTPTSRAAALEAKKLRQKLLLKGQPPTGRAVRGDGILNTSLAYYLPYGSLVQDPNPEEECLQAQVEIPQWGTRILTSLYVMEGTENLEDEVFLKRHSKPEQDEKRRKRWDLQRMREQRHYERLRERYEGRQNTSEPEVSGYRSLWPNPESALYLHVDDCLPVCAFGQPMARIPPQEFSLPWLSGRSQEGISTRRRKRP